MDYDPAIACFEEYVARKQLVLIGEAAGALKIHERTIETWIRRKRPKPGDPLAKHPFPKWTRLTDAPLTARYWRPDELIAWVKAMKQWAADTMTVEECCRLIGVKNAETIRKMVAAGKFPKPCGKQLLTGKQVWDRATVVAWHEEKSGGYRFASADDPQPSEKPAASRRGPRSKAQQAAATGT